MNVFLRRIASRSTHPMHKHATIVLKGGAVLATGYNHEGRHSEVVALSKLWPSKRRGTTIINLRIKPSGEIGNSSPCPECLAFLRKNGVRKILVVS